MILIGLDVGYGQTKAICSNGKSIVFPSYTAQVDTTVAQNTSSVIETKEGKWLVGQDALANANARTPPVDSSWYRSTPYRLLVTKALRDLGIKPKERVKIFTGLPVAHVDQHKQALKAEINSWNQYGIKADVMGVVAQPIGTMYSVAYKEDLAEREGFGGRVGVVDIGRGTIDAVEIKDHKINLSVYGSSQDGVVRVYAALQNEIFATHKLDYDLSEIPAIMKAGELQKHGQVKNLKAPIQRAKQATLVPLRRLVQGLWGDQGTLSKLIITGGGAIELQKDIEAMFHKNILVIPESPDMANAKGYLALAKQIAK